MKFFNSTFFFFRNKKINNNFINNYFLYNIDFSCWNYTIDTWKLLNTERFLIDLEDVIFFNYFFKNTNTKINLNFFNYLYFLYIFFFLSKSNLNNFNYLNFYNTKNSFFIQNQKLFYNNYSLKNLQINSIYLFNFLWKDFFFINFYKTFIKINKKKNILLFYYWRKFFKNIFEIYFINNLINIKLNIKTIIVKKNYLVFNFFKNNNYISKLFYFKKLNNFFLNKKLNNFFLNKPIIFNNFYNLNTFSLLRKQKIYTKNKYSRSRQYCKNIVLLGLLLNIILMFGLNSSYYAILINLSYFIYVIYLILIIFSFYFTIKYKLFNFKNY